LQMLKESFILSPFQLHNVNTHSPQLSGWF
jgi:hypothetical protein